MRCCPGAIDIAGAGVGPLLTIWDRTRGRQNVKAVASLGNFPYYLLSNDPRVRSIADFGAGDRIAVPAVGVSVQSRFLQYAAAKQWGDKQFDRLDKYTVALPHPDATAALVAGGTELTGHFSNPPFQDQALANPKVHVVLDSYELLGPNSPTVLFATEKFRQDNPKTYRAFVEALKEAAAFAQNDKAAAADTYIRVTGAKIDRAALLKIIANPRVEFSVTPKNTYPLAEFLYRVGAIRNKPASWQDYFFQDGAPLQGVETPMNAASRQPSTHPADALLAVDGVSLEYRTRSRVVRGHPAGQLRSRPGRSLRPARPVRLRQVDPAQGGGWLHHAQRGRDPPSGTGGQGARPRPYRGVPGVRPVAAMEDRTAERAVPLAGVRPGDARRGRATRRRMPREGRPGGLRRGLPATRCPGA